MGLVWLFPAFSNDFLLDLVFVNSSIIYNLQLDFLLDLIASMERPPQVSSWFLDTVPDSCGQ